MITNKLKWTLMESLNGPRMLQAEHTILSIPKRHIVAHIVESRFRTCSVIVKMDGDYILTKSEDNVFSAMNDVEYTILERIEQYTPAAPVNPTHPSLDGVPAPKEIEPNIRSYLSTVPIKDQLVRTSNPNRFSLFNLKILCGEYILSIQCNEHTYCSPRQDIQDPSKYDSFEFAVMDKNYEFCGKRLFPSQFQYDDVMGYVDENLIQEMANIIKDLPEGYVHPNTKPVEEDEPKDKPVAEEKPTGPTKFYTYRQNNSGGSWTGPAKYVIVEATSALDADKRAQTKGLYFDGSGDCSCCGTRWSEAYEGEGESEPKIYDSPAREYTTEYASFGDDVVIFYADGREDRWDIPVVKKND